MDPIVILTNASNLISKANTAAQHLISVDKKISEADLKLSIAEITAALADVKFQVSELKSIIMSKDDEIKKLNEALSIKGEVTRQGSCYYRTNENGEPVGQPYCSACWETKHTLLHVIFFKDSTGSYMYCPQCNSKYIVHRTR